MVFITSLYKINQIINKKLVKRFLPTYLLDYRDAFLKAALDILPYY